MKQHILVIEDSKAQAKLVESLLVSIGCESTLAFNGEEARAKYNTSQYDLILLDMVLPDASGLQLLNEIKASKKNLETSVIILSGVTDKGNIVDALNLGASDYITKPFHQTEFIIRLKLHLSMQRANRELKQTVAAKDKLIAVIAHDLRDPFSGLLGFAKMLANGHRTFNEEQRDQYVNMVYNSAIGLHELLNNLVMWASIQKSDMAPDLKLIQPHVLVEEAITILKPAMDSKENMIALKLDKKVTLKADPNMFSSLIRNLITNGMRFAQPGKTVLLSSKPMAEEGKDGLEFSLLIPGEGFPAALLEATRNSESEKGPHGKKGLGLGLSLAFDFV